MLTRNFGNQLLVYGVASQKSENLIYKAADA